MYSFNPYTVNHVRKVLWDKNSRCFNSVNVRSMQNYFNQKFLNTEFSFACCTSKMMALDEGECVSMVIMFKCLCSFFSVVSQHQILHIITCLDYNISLRANSRSHCLLIIVDIAQAIHLCKASNSSYSS